MRSTLRPASSPAYLVAWRCESVKLAGTVMTAFDTGAPRCRSAQRLRCARMYDDTSGTEYLRPRTTMSGCSLGPSSHW